MDSTTVLLEEALTSHLGSLYRYCHRMTGSQEEAEDLAQEVLLAALKHRKSLAGEGFLRPWLFGIAHHKVCHHLRRKTVERLFHPQVRAEPEFSEAAAVQGLIDSLPARQREAFLLVRIEGFTSLEAAKVLGAPEGTVKHRVFQAVRKLQKSMQESGLHLEEARNVP